jgi:sulfide dehydrogenase [flavocytochrome c] flavoprotein subunit
MALERRKFLKVMGAAGALPVLASCARRMGPRVVVVGGGFGGATCAKYLKIIDPGIRVTLIERSESYATCPFSNNVIAGLRSFDSLLHGYDALETRWGIAVIHDTAAAVDAGKRRVTLASGKAVAYDRLVLSPGIDMNWSAIEGYGEDAADIMPHAWKAGPQTVLLQKQLAGVEDGGLVVIAAPDNPYRCPPAPYERACMIAHYLKSSGRAKSKIVILDAKDKFTKQELFVAGWNRFYPGMIEWVSGSAGGQVTQVDPQEMTVTCKAGTFKPAVANIVPPQMAGRIAQAAGAATQDGWCEVDPWTMESKAATSSTAWGLPSM